MEKLTADDIRDVAIRITDKLVELGYVPDCIDTDDDDESIVQDIIFYQIISALKQVSSRTPQ
jgi:hypothetical protein